MAPKLQAREAWRLATAAAGLAVVAGGVALLDSPKAAKWPLWLATFSGATAFGLAVAAREGQAHAEERLHQVTDERRDALAAMERSNKDLEQFAYMASHDLKAPLRGIAHLAVWIREDLGDGIPTGVAENLELLQGRVERMEALINSLLAYARAGRAPRIVEQVDTRALLTETVDLLSLGEGAAQVEISDRMPVMWTPRAPLQQVWMNLLSNAFKHGKRGERESKVECAATDLGEHWCFSVRDHGPGIPNRYHDRAFALFQTLSPRDRVEGAGIGLAIVKKLVEAEGGKVWIEGEPDTGAKLCFTWPKRARSSAT
ncbi:MAG: ATP-binding protein [Myxococcaceae bacterium]